MLLPIVGAMSSVLMMVVLRNGQPLFLMVAAVVFVVAIVSGVAFALTARGRRAREAHRLRGLYLDHLEQVRSELKEQGEAAREQALTLHPAPAALPTLVRDPERLWERRRRDADFLTARLGQGEASWFDIVVPAETSPLEPHDEILVKEANHVAETARTVSGMPITADLIGAGVISVIGDHARAVALVRSLVAQLAVSHSPDDLIVAAAYPIERAKAWHGLDLLPHLQDSELFDAVVPARRVAPDLTSLLEVLTDELSRRVARVRTAQRLIGAPAPTPRLLIILDEHGALAGTFPLDTSADIPAHETTIIRILADRLHEPDNTQVRVLLTDEQATLTTGADTAEQNDTTFTPDALTSSEFAAITRSLAGLRVSMTAREQAAETGTVNITDLIGIAGLDDVTPEALWQPRSPEDFLRVPFGVDDLGNHVLLDLKESAQFGMGPHGICIGATGSGKSEMLRTLLLSLAIAHPPEDLSMILVDYKGGAAFAPFADLPHVAGLIDNLADEPQLTTRARASIQGEVVRRQKMLKDAGSLPSISVYRALRDEQPDLPPMPHLFVVIDEFGELLAAEPEFVDLFLQIGRIGRSIGVHLLLSSQRIEAGRLRGLDTYLSYRLGLRTFSESESQVVLNTPDAFHLPSQPGYGYLKVDVSVYTRFRAGYVSGPVPRDVAIRAEAETAPRPYLLSIYNGIDVPSDQKAKPELTRSNTGATLVDEVVERLSLEDRNVRSVWLPPLAPRLALGEVLGDRPGSGSLDVVVGLLDDPAHQEQRPWSLDLTAGGGHAVIIGAPQSGRSTFLRTVGASLALTRTPREVAIYGLDLTGGGLRRLEGFPHVGGVATRANRDQVRRLLEELTGMIAQRELLFATHGIDSMTQLRTLHGAGALPGLSSADIVVLVDGYGSLRQDFEELEDAFTSIMLRASSFGIHLILGLTRWSELRMAHQALFGTKYELRLNDPADSTIDRKLASTVNAQTPGRALLDSMLLGQVALPVLDADVDDVGDALAELAQRTAASWSGPAAAPIRLLPSHLDPAELPDEFDAPDVVPVGLRQDTMETAVWDFLGDDQHLIALGDTGSGKSTLLEGIVERLIDRFTSDELVIAVMDTRGTLAPAVPDEYLGAHARNATQARGLATSIAAELAERPNRSAEEHARAPRIVIMVDDYDIVSAGGTDPLGPLLPHLPSARDLKLNVIVTRPVAGANRALYERALQMLRDTGGAMFVMSGDRAEGQLAPRLFPERFPPGRGRWVRRGERPHVVQIADSRGTAA